MSPPLGELDRRLADVYRRTLDATVDPAPLIAEQRAWSRRARAECRDDDCIARRWRERIALLERWNDRLQPVSGDLGRYAFARRQPVLESNRWVERRTWDCLSLEARPDGDVDVALHLVRVNGHSCGLRGRMTWSGTGLEFAGSDDPQLTGCRLRVRFGPATLQLEDPDDGCRRAACGVRAGIDGTSFPRSGLGGPACRR